MIQDNINEQKQGKMNSLKRFLINLFDIRGDMMSYEDIDAMMEENTDIHGSNMWILMMAIMIASIGLNVNSTAVIIGAMLISPLMSGILTMGYSLAVRDLKLMRRALLSFGVQMVISLITSSIYFSISPLGEPTAEMIARTSPTIWDVLIALFGGIAGIIGNTRQKKSNVIPGVAIATALMPPLCTAGYGIATMQAKFLLGAFYLFFINTLFIALSAALVTVLLGVPAHQSMDERRQKRINRIVAVITVVTVIPSLLIGAYTVYSSYIENQISDYLKEEFVFSDTQLVQSSYDQSAKMISVSLVGTPIDQETISFLEREMEKYDLEEYTLHVTQNTVRSASESENTDKVTIAVQEKAIAKLQEELEAKREQLAEMESKATAKLDLEQMSNKAESIFSSLSDCKCGIIADETGEYIILVADAEKDLTDSEISVIENWLKEESKVEQARLFIEQK